MRYGPDKKRETRERVLYAAARSLRRHGPHTVGVAEVMREAGLTHGGFYAHFKSKDDLVAHAVGKMFDDAVAHFDRLTLGRKPGAAVGEYVAFYLSREHWAARDTGCPLASIGSDVRRLPQAAWERFEAGAAALSARLARLLEALGHEDSDGLAINFLGELVGALLLARAVTDEQRAAAMLDSARGHAMHRLGLEPHPIGGQAPGE